ncbi:hypothetical protein HER10_EVM0011489 [Colletotrichum scovillei]|uniref:uncharacterized protein n=1 Tax=Colletotrichum scovillei TaxID=1209932 RepID=UPI0015C39B0F|nr:uncharacterized protein HER10_EVM0011489 [Colletotrichum scovillei]KAF4774310.1 hypothetical protein HER10_EVM0011489 [Colletotrichum scovillei]
MRFHQVQALIVASLAVLAYGSATTNLAPIEGYEIIIPEWEFQDDISPRTEKVVLNGTVQEVLADLRSYDSLYAQVLGSESGSTTTSSALEEPNKFDLSHVVCHKFPLGSVPVVKEGINDLKRIRHRRAKLEVGRGKCALMSCEFKTAIWWCNDDDNPKTMRTFDGIAQGAEKVLQTCAKRNSPNVLRSSGQAFDKMKWSVVVRGENC